MRGLLHRDPRRVSGGEVRDTERRLTTERPIAPPRAPPLRVAA